MIEAVILDLDGTLIHLPVDYEKLFQEFSEIMGIENIHPLTKTISRLDEKTRKKIFEVWDKAEFAVLKDITIKDEGMTIYRKFSEKPKALATMQGKAIVQNILKSLNLSFNFVVTREDNLDRTEQLRIAAQRFGVRLQNILFVGNTEGDFISAKNVACQFLRVGE